LAYILFLRKFDPTCDIMRALLLQKLYLVSCFFPFPVLTLLAGLLNTTPTMCPLCRKRYDAHSIKKLHLDGPPPENDPEEERLIQKITDPLARDGSIDELVTQIETLLVDRPSESVRALYILELLCD
jgi:hypothetical protein